MSQSRIRALHQRLTDLVAHPEPCALVIGCTDPEVPLLAHILARVESERPTDRFVLITAPPAIRPRPVPRDSSPITAPHTLHRILADHLSDLAAQQRLVLALLPAQIHRGDGFSDLALQLLETPLHPRLRLILRDDRLDPHHLDVVAAAPSERRGAHVFSLPPRLSLAAIHAVAHDRRRPSHERATLLLQLAGLTLAHGHRVDPSSDPAPSLALTLQAELLRHHGDLDAATALALAALRQAIAARTFPVACHAALTLAELGRDLAELAAALASDPPRPPDSPC